MAFWDFLNRTVPLRVFTPNITYVGGAGTEGYADALGVRLLTPAQMWRTQPHLRTVVSFLARNVAQLALHTYERLDETDRRRDRRSPVATALRRPNADMTGFDLVFALVGDMSLYDVAYWHVSEDPREGWRLRRLPPGWVSPVARDVFGARAYTVVSPQGESVDVPASEVLAFSGYHPTDPTKGSPTVESLRETLQEQIEAAKYRGQVWRRGGRVSAVLQRPKDAPEWSEGAREAFAADWYSKYTGNGHRAGGTPILEDGMTLNRIDFTAHEQQFVEAAKLSFSTVASAFHVNPTMVGILDNANYSNVREFRRMLYGDTLGPLIAQIEDRVNTFLLPMLGMDSDRFYVEFNIAEKLQGSFEEQAAVMQTMVGAPIMTRNEGRAKFNMAAIDGGDELVTPLNVLIGGQASPTDSAPPALASRPVAVKARAPQTHEAKYRQVLGKFFRRQRAAVSSLLGAKAGRPWWDEDRWNKELSDDLLRLGLSTSTAVAKATLEAAGLDPEKYSAEQTVAFLTAGAEAMASRVNTKTREGIDQTLASDDPDVAAVFDQAEGARAAMLAASLVTAMSGFGSREAGQQAGAKTKTWNTGANPRQDHAAMDGETVALDRNFSNGLAWPGDAAGDADDLAGCNCSLSINF